MEKKIKHCFVAVGAVIAAVLGYIGARLFGSARQKDDNIRDTVESITTGIAECSESVREVKSSIECVEGTSEELRDAIESSESSTRNAQETISDIRELIKARRESLKEENS